MKKLLVVSLVLNAALLFAVWHAGAPAAAQGGGAGPVAPAPEVACYDANGDGAVDLADPVTLLNWLFLGRGTPEICASEGGAPTGLPATGQTLCYGVAKAGVVDCTSDACVGQDGLYTAGCPSEGRFVDNKDGTVTDTCTRLMWQKDTGNDRVGLAWCDALAYCEELDLAGHDDWRLPNVREVQSIVDYALGNKAIDPVFGAVATFYWTSTTRANDDVDAWRINFNEGFVFNADKSNANRVRAVRSAQ